MSFSFFIYLKLSARTNLHYSTVRYNATLRRVCQLQLISGVVRLDTADLLLVHTCLVEPRKQEMPGVGPN